MKKTELLNQYLERQKHRQLTVKVDHIEAVVVQLLAQNPQWNFKDMYELKRYVGLPRSPHCPLVRWTSRKPFGPQNAVWCFPELFPALPSYVAVDRGGRPGSPVPFKDWAAEEVGLVADAEAKFRKAVFYWPHSDREDPGWVNRAFSQGFSKALVCDVDPFNSYASPEEFQSCL